MAELFGWGNFYLIVGGAAGALIGLQFVVLTLIAERPAVTGQEMAGSAFATPTIIHFSTVLLLSAIVSAPWHSVAGVAILWGLVGFTGILYEIIVFRRMRIQNIYKPQFEDWLFHVLLPFAAYAAVAGSAPTTPGTPSHIMSFPAVTAKAKVNTRRPRGADDHFVVPASPVIFLMRRPKSRGGMPAH